MRLRYSVLPLIILVATATSFFAVSAKSIWLDEAASIHVASSFEALIQTLWSSEIGMWLYKTLLFLWTRAGNGEFVVRSLSAMFAVLTIPTVYLLGRRLFGAKVGLGAAFLLAINAFFVEYAQEARGYSMVLFFSALAAWLFLRALDHPTPRNLLVYAISGICLLYSHLVAASVIAGHAAALTAYALCMAPPAARPRLLLRFGAVYLATALGCLPMLLTPGRADYDLSWIPPFREDMLIEFAQELAGHDQLLPIYGFIIAAGIIYAWAARPKTAQLTRQITPDTWRYGFTLISFAVPLSLNIGISLLIQPLFVYRYLIMCLLPFVLLAAQGLCQLRAIAIPAWLILVPYSAKGLYDWYIAPPREDWRGTVALIQAQASAEDGVILVPAYAATPFSYYFGRFVEQDSLPELVALSPETRYAVSPAGQAVIPDGDRRLIERDVPERYRRVWLIIAPTHGPGARQQREYVVDGLTRRYHALAGFNPRRIQVIQFERQDATQATGVNRP